MPRSRPHLKVQSRHAGWPALLLAATALVLLATPSRGQQPILPPVTTTPEASALSPSGPSEPALGNPIAPQPDDLPPAYQDGPLALRPHFLYRFMYADGIQATPGHKSTTFIDTFAPGLFVGIGTNWTVDYTPSWDVYSNSAFENTIDQALYISGKQAFDTWSVQFVQSYLKSSEPLVETGVQTNEQDLLTGLSITHVLSAQFSVEADFNQYLRFADGFPDSRDWSDTDWLNYHVTSAVTVGVGVGLGIVDDNSQPVATFTNPEARVTWKPGKKLSVSADVGTEHREFYGHPKTGLTSPTFDVFAEYSIFDGTKLRASTGRQITDSYFVGETSKNTYWNASIEQRLLTHWNLSAGFGHDDTTYVSTVVVLDNARQDNETSYFFKLSWTFTRRGTLSLLYNSLQDRSTLENYRYTSNQAGLEADYKF